VVLLVVALGLAGCAKQIGDASDDRRGGFYGGVSGGISRP